MTTKLHLMRAEHETVKAELDRLDRAIDAIGHEDLVVTADILDGMVAFFHDVVFPHAEAEDHVLYPAVATILGSPRSTDTMVRDHGEIRALVDQLAHLVPKVRTEHDEEVRNAARRVGYSLTAILRLHLSKEEEIYLPMLDVYLTDREAIVLAEKMAVAHHT